MLYEMNALNNVQSQWTENIRHVLGSSVLEEYGTVTTVYCQSFLNVKWLIRLICRKLKDCFIQKLHIDMQLTLSTNIYKDIKTDFGKSAY
jgi:hypothetical protein